MHNNAINKLKHKSNISGLSWFDENLKPMREPVHFLHYFYKSNPAEANNAVYNNYRFIYQSKVKYKDNYVRNHDNPQKAMWNIINSLNIDSNPTLSIATAEELNNFFVDIF